MLGNQSKTAPKVSIIIPTFETAGMIKACMDSVFAQTYTDFEAVVINDGSPDTPELEEVLQPYMDRIFYIKQENKRCAGARNNGCADPRWTGRAGTIWSKWLKLPTSVRCARTGPALPTG